MRPVMSHGDSRGFTLIELAIVITIIGILYVSAMPRGTATVMKTKEAVLAHNLKVMRDALDDYNADFGEYPAELNLLVEKRYVRTIPVDPFVESADMWTTLPSDPALTDIFDVKSSADGTGTNGVAYSEW